MQRNETDEIFKEFDKLGDYNTSFQIFAAIQGPLSSSAPGVVDERTLIFSNEKLTAALIDTHYDPTLLEKFFVYCTKSLIAGATYEADPAAFKLISLAQQSKHRCYRDTFLDVLKANIKTPNPIKKDSAITSLLAYIALLDLSLFLSQTPDKSFVELKKVDISSPINKVTKEEFSADILIRMRLVKESVQARYKQEKTFKGLGKFGKVISPDKGAIYNAIINVADKFSINPDTEKYMLNPPSAQIDSIKKLQILMNDYAIKHEYTKRSGKK